MSTKALKFTFIKNEKGYISSMIINIFMIILKIQKNILLYFVIKNHQYNNIYGIGINDAIEVGTCIIGNLIGREIYVLF